MDDDSKEKLQLEIRSYISYIKELEGHIKDLNTCIDFLKEEIKKLK